MIRKSHATASDTAYHWRQCDKHTPRGVKLQLIDRYRSGVAAYGQWQPGSQWTHWAPLPTFADSVAPEWCRKCPTCGSDCNGRDGRHER